MATAAPLVDRRVIEALLEAEFPRALGKRTVPRLVLVHGRYDSASPAEFAVRIGEDQQRVQVSDQSSVLGVVDAWQTHQSAQQSAQDLGSAILVVTTTVDESQLGWDVRGHALGRKTLSVDRAQIVKQRFGAADLDPRIRREGWLIDALLSAEPAEGWRSAAADWRRGGGAVLTRDAAVRALIGARFGLPGDQTLDADTLLAWSRSAGGPMRFAELPAAERDGLTGWLRESVGESAMVLLALATAGQEADAMALGVIGAVLADPAASADAVLAVGGLFAGVSGRLDELRAFSAAVQGTLARWISEAEADRSEHQSARQRVMAVLDRADVLAKNAGLGPALAANAFLPSGFQARLHTCVAALSDSAAAAEQALEQLTDHHLAGLHRDRWQVARMAVRLRRWLDVSTDSPDAGVASVAAGVRAHLSTWGWVDRALTVLWAGDPASDAVAGNAYRRLYREVSGRRADLDRAFAGRLATWVRGASATAPGGCLLIEEVLRQVVLPLAARRPPLVLVLDGMSSAVAAELGEQLAHRNWIEATATPGVRRAAVSMIPSLTTISRASLLSGTPASGGQGVERTGFAAFWQRHRREGALFHKSAVGGGAGQRLAQPLMDALAADQVVGVVLNTIDDALDHDREGSRVGWNLTDITYLSELLDAARGYGRPIVLVSDHGHVLDRTEPGSPPTRPGEAARWRTGTGPMTTGEVELSGPRVLEGGGTVVAPWSEEIRYTPRKAGYHGGAALAEMTVPVLVALPSLDLLPAGWSVLPPEDTTPAWWAGGRGAAPAAAPRFTVQAPDDAQNKPAGDGLFTVTPVVTLGSQVVASAVYGEQKKYVRKAPDPGQVAAVIDALAAAGGTLSPTAVNAAAADAGGRAPRNAEMFITALQRLLNVEGYLVVGLVDSGRTVRLDVRLLREQFGIAES
jgi:hypothetical protein